MRILITGGAGFLGDRLARTLLSRESVTVAGRSGSVEQVVLVDRVPPRPELLGDPRVRAVTGELSESLRAGILSGVDVVFHLAAVVSSEAERDFDLGMRVNLATTQELLESARADERPPRVVFASSLAVFGSAPGLPLPEVITDSTLPTPQSSYGIQKFIGEQLVADYARRGLVPARSVRLMTVAVRPGAPNAAASSFLSGIVREPLAGLPSNSPVPPSTEVALGSPTRTVDGLLRAAGATDEEWGPLTALTLPALTVTVGEMVEALARVAGPSTAALVGWEPDPTIARIVTSWPSRFEASRAHRLGLRADPDFDTIIAAHLADEG